MRPKSTMSNPETEPAFIISARKEDYLKSKSEPFMPYVHSNSETAYVPNGLYLDGIRVVGRQLYYESREVNLRVQQRVPVFLENVHFHELAFVSADPTHQQRQVFPELVEPKIRTHVHKNMYFKSVGKNRGAPVKVVRKLPDGTLGDEVKIYVSSQDGHREYFPFFRVKSRMEFDNRANASKPETAESVSTASKSTSKKSKQTGQQSGKKASASRRKGPPKRASGGRPTVDKKHQDPATCSPEKKKIRHHVARGLPFNLTPPGEDDEGSLGFPNWVSDSTDRLPFSDGASPVSETTPALSEDEGSEISSGSSFVPLGIRQPELSGSNDSVETATQEVWVRNARGFDDAHDHVGRRRSFEPYNDSERTLPQPALDTIVEDPGPLNFYRFASSSSIGMEDHVSEAAPGTEADSLLLASDFDEPQSEVSCGAGDMTEARCLTKKDIQDVQHSFTHNYTLCDE